MDVSIELQMLGKVIVAALLGGVVGLEREFAERTAGLRTHMLVGAAAAFFVMLASHMNATYGRQDILNIDPVRVIEAIVLLCLLIAHIRENPTCGMGHSSIRLSAPRRFKIN